MNIGLVMRLVGGRSGERSGERMLRARRSRVMGWLAGAIVAVSVLGASVDSAQAMQLSSQQKQEMKLHYERATRAYDVQKYSEAVEEYQKAYEIGGDPAMLYNVAQAYRLDDQLPEAVRFYRRYLQRSPNARNRDDVEKKIADLEKTIEERRKSAAATPPAPVPTPAPTPVAEPAPGPALGQNGNGGDAQAGEDPGFGKRVAGIVFLSVGGAALITSAVTGKMASSKASELTDASNNGGTFDPALESSGKNLNTVAIAAAVFGGVAAAVGTVLLLTAGGESSGESAPSTQALITPVIGGGTVGASALVRF